MFKSIKVRIYPNKIQSSYINRLVGSYRKVYNMCLEKKMSVYNIDKKNIGLKELSKYFHHELIKIEELSYLKKYHQ